MRDVAGRTAIITGAGSGIGRALALDLAAAGANIVAIGTTDVRLVAVRADIAALGGRCETLPRDVRDADVFTAARDLAMEAFGRVDIVVNNAAAIGVGFPEDIPLEEWQRVFDVNVMALVRSNAVFVPILLEQGAGHIINVASVDGLYGFGYDRLPYAASKGAVVILSEGLALYLKPRGVGVTCFCPGPVATNIGAGMRLFGRPVDVHGPGRDYGFIEPEAAARAIVEAIRDDRFLVLGHAETVSILRRRVADTDAFVAAQIADPHILFAAGALPGGT